MVVVELGLLAAATSLTTKMLLTTENFLEKRKNIEMFHLYLKFGDSKEI